MEFTTIYFKNEFKLDNIDFYDIEKLFGVDIGSGYKYINVYTIDRSIIDSIADEVGRENIKEIAYP
jgi:hypothetical protein